jgi:HEAT repeat protein
MRPLTVLMLLMVAACQLTACQPSGNGAAATPLEKQIELLHSRSPVDRARAARKIGGWGSSAAPAVPGLLRLLGDNGRAKSRLEGMAAWAFQSMNPLGSSGPASVGEEAAIALAKIGAPAVDALIDATNATDDDVRTRSFRALRLINDAPAFDTFRAGLHERNEKVRFESLLGIAASSRPDAVALLAPLLDDRSITIRTNAVHALAGIGGREGLGMLSKDLAARDTYFRIAVCEGLGKMQKADTVPLLVSLLRNPEWSVRMSAAQGLGFRKDRRAIRPRIDALADGNDAVRGQAGTSLRLITGASHGADKEKWELWWVEHGASKQGRYAP